MRILIYPLFVYRSPGKHQANGGTYDYVLVESPEELPIIASQGYYPTVELAVANQKNPEAFNWPEYLGLGTSLEVAGGDTTPSTEESTDLSTETKPLEQYTREELEIEAQRLNIRFRRNISDKVLLSKIRSSL